MSAILAENFHIHSAVQFMNSFTEPITEGNTTPDIYYMFIGRPTPWPTSDVSPTAPTDSSKDMAYDYWRDMIGMKRVTADHMCSVTLRYNWTANTQYSMTDYRVGRTIRSANTFHPYYVITPDNEVFKCLYNGRVNATSGPSNSTSQPTTSGQVDITGTTTAGGDLANYTWKYLYTISPNDADMFMTNNFIPVRNADDQLNDDGDVLNDASDLYTIFNHARVTGNGAIQNILVEIPGSGYNSVPDINIIGDGSDARATATVSSGQITAINITSPGQNYSWATVEIIPAISDTSATGATATVIIPPRASFTNSSGVFYYSNHAVNLREELGAKYVMLHMEFAADEDGMLSTGNDYRRIGLIRNPILYGSNQIATANAYKMTTDLTIVAPSGAFTQDELVWQPQTNAYGVVVEQTSTVLKLTGVAGGFTTTGNTYILGIGNGLANGQPALPSSLLIPSVPEAFSPSVVASGASASVTEVSLPEIQAFSGTILYADHRVPITRSNTQTEVLRTILTF